MGYLSSELIWEDYLGLVYIKLNTKKNYSSFKWKKKLMFDFKNYFYNGWLYIFFLLNFKK